MIVNLTSREPDPTKQFIMSYWFQILARLYYLNKQPFYWLFRFTCDKITVAVYLHQCNICTKIMFKLLLTGIDVIKTGGDFIMLRDCN